MSDTPKDTHLQTDILVRKPTPEKVKNVSAIQGVMNTPAVSEKEKTTLQKAAKRADLFVPEHIRGGETVERYKLRGRIGEELAQDNMPGSINLNDVAQKPNIASYDLVSPYEMASVKVKEREDEGLPRFADYDKYFRDITNPGSRANLRAAEDLVKLREEAPEQWQKLAGHLPPEVASTPDVKTMAKALPDKSSLRISGDQVAEVRSHIKEHILESPAAYSLDPNLDQQTLAEQAQRLVRDHIKPIDPKYNVGEMGTVAKDIQDRRRMTAHPHPELEKEPTPEGEPFSLRKSPSQKPGKEGEKQLIEDEQKTVKKNLEPPKDYKPGIERGG